VSGIRREGIGVGPPRERERGASVRSAAGQAEGPSPGTVGALGTERADSDASEAPSGRRFESRRPLQGSQEAGPESGRRQLEETSRGAVEGEPARKGG